MQETHSTLADEKLWEDDWGGKIAFSHGKSNSRGVCIMMNISADLHDKSVETEGRYIICEKRFTILSIYAPNQDDPNFITTCLSTLEEQQNDDRVMVGDFNCIVDNTLNKKGGGVTHSNKNMQALLKAYLE